MRGVAKKMLGGFLVLSAVLGSFSVPAAADTPDTAVSWDLFEGRAENYESDFKISSGYDVSSDVVFQDGYVKIQKGNEIELGKGKYLWLCPGEKVDLPEDTPFTAETTLRMAGEVKKERGERRFRQGWGLMRKIQMENFIRCICTMAMGMAAGFL